MDKEDLIQDFTMAAKFSRRDDRWKLMSHRMRRYASDRKLADICKIPLGGTFQTGEGQT
jgi:hypothetical protein